MSQQDFPALPDQDARNRFRRELEHNFSVIAPAGVGKTTAIVDRIAAIALQDEQLGTDRLKHLVVVTYTKKAAAEMAERARRRLSSSGGDLAARMAAFKGAYFGTIHSFCLELLRRWGALLGLPTQLVLASDKEALWNTFLREQDGVLDGMPQAIRAILPRFVDLRDVCELAKKLPAGAPKESLPEGLTPMPNLSDLLAYVPKRKNSIPVVERHQRLLRQWQDRMSQDDHGVWVGLPKCSGGGAEFKAMWETEFTRLRDWLGTATAHAAVSFAKRFRDFRIARGEVYYDDMISLCGDLMAHPVAGRLIREQEFRVILDEAQDTDPTQFAVLLSVAQSVERNGAWQDGQLPPPGRFCMVGDPQQSIYADRADIATYLAVHEALVGADGGEEATFTVTMRCDQAVVDWVNQSAPAALNGADGQVGLVPLQARPGAGGGGVSVYRIEPKEAPDPRKTKQTAQEEARAVAAWLQALSLDDFGIRDWSEMALLCPRKSRLEALADALGLVELPFQNHSRSDARGDNPAFAWGTALIVIMAEPDNAFEVAGVLRELYGISDGALAAYVASLPKTTPLHPLSLLRHPVGDSQVAQVLKRLVSLRSQVQTMPLRSAVETVFAECDLHARLSVLPDVDLSALEVLSSEAAKAEEAGEDWTDLAQSLRLSFAGDGGEADPEPGKIQLLTCQKAKGLEWPLVIVPFMFAEIANPKTNYPLPLPGADGRWGLALDSAHETSEAKDWLARRTQQSLERLLYVTLTRPRQRLIFVDDESFFPKGKDSFAGHLRLREGEENRAIWQGLPLWQPETAELNHFKEAKSDGVLPSPLREQLIAPEAGNWIRRVLPSSLANHDVGAGHERSERDRQAEPEYPEIARSGTGGTGYGNWWHGTMETMPWSAPETWERHWAFALGACPDPERGQREVGVFLQGELASTLGKATTVRTEVPMLWRVSDTEAYDGSIDLVAQREDGTWLLVDWKTDRVRIDPVGELLAAYGPQLGAYKRALEAIFGDTVEALLYSTRTGLPAYLD